MLPSLLRLLQLLSLLLGFAFDSLSVTMYLYGAIVLVACAVSQDSETAYER